MTAFENAWAIVKGYEPPTFTPEGAKWFGEKQHTLRDGIQGIRSFRNLRNHWRKRPMMSIQTKLLDSDGRKKSDYTTIATSSTVPLNEYTKLIINRPAQQRAWTPNSKGKIQRNKHGYAEGLTSRDIIEQMLYDKMNPQDLLDYDVEYNKHGDGMPIVLDSEGRPAPTASYWPYEDKERTIPNRYGGSFVLTQLDSVDDNPRKENAARMIIPDNTELGLVSVVTPYGAAFPNASMEELMREIGGTRI